MALKKGFTVWLTGLPCSGKTTTANEVARSLKARGLQVELLDGDEIRRELNCDLGFSKEDRETNIRRVAFLCKILSRNGVVAIAAVVSPYYKLRQHARSQNPRFVEVFVDCPLEECIRRDSKKMYEKALRGEIKNFTGIDDPYEVPKNPEVIVHTKVQTPKECSKLVLEKLRTIGFI